ncbi:MAG: YghX family hydrolase [Jannaschia helgolandensis]|jgi:carboxymethylenebutenolidase|uniref:Carboxymethylenebutenolidase n=1 Tax=Jannaschia helgolandensis TaxID=188906 RepID=A0A1H7HVU1_9RHOB|nr:YghX family hydrolase [Jannaschia helgolandensis]SEK54298.1 carboxymethylenebutenolidase [Jannaschia helgolandensis]|tara:strand:- start:3899 stop:4786 length:888 start_codon:yes stop_codon:yes gene_type:complete
MTRMTAKDFDQDLLDLYDFYAHGKITKREFLDRAGKWAVGGLTAAAILTTLSPNYALAQQVAEDDPDISGKDITYDSPNGHGGVNGYLVRPATTETPPAAVLVVHENRGLNPYIRDVARRVAKAGFIALAPDGLSSVGGYPGNDDEGRELQRGVDGEKLMNDFFAGYEYLAALDGINGKVGATGFCYGGGVVNALAVAYPELSAGVPFYGRQAAVEDVPRIETPLLFHYAALDNRINAGWPAMQKALEENDKVYQAEIWPDVNHGFHNDTTPRYDAEAAEAAWEKTIAWFRVYLA